MHVLCICISFEVTGRADNRAHKDCNLCYLTNLNSLLISLCGNTMAQSECRCMSSHVCLAKPCSGQL